MAYKITDACIMCGACADGCPVNAISEGASQYEIDADACLDCGACAATCPTESITQYFTSKQSKRFTLTGEAFLF